MILPSTVEGTWTAHPGALYVFLKGEDQTVDAIKSCPCCDGYSRLQWIGKKNRPGTVYFVECARCGLRTRPELTIEYAIYKWNLRLGEKSNE